MPLATIEAALEEIKKGNMVIVVDDEDRENEGDLIFAAEKVTPEAVAFMVKHCSGIIFVSMEGERLEQLNLPLMVSDNSESMRTAFTISVDAHEGNTTGISAADRCSDHRNADRCHRSAVRPCQTRSHLSPQIHPGGSSSKGRPYRGFGGPRQRSGVVPGWGWLRDRQ